MRNRTPNIDLPVADLSLAEFYGDASFVHADVVEQLADSIGRVGQLIDITVWQRPDGTRAIIAGRKRWMAAKKIGLATVRCTVVECDHETALAVFVEDNFVRSNVESGGTDLRSIIESAQALNNWLAPIIKAAERYDQLAPATAVRIFTAVPSGRNNGDENAYRELRQSTVETGIVTHRVIVRASNNVISQGNARAAVDYLRGVANGTLSARAIELKNASCVSAFVSAAKTHNATVAEQEAAIDDIRTMATAKETATSGEIVENVTARSVVKRVEARSGKAEARVRQQTEERVDRKAPAAENPVEGEEPRATPTGAAALARREDEIKNSLSSAQPASRNTDSESAGPSAELRQVRTLIAGLKGVTRATRDAGLGAIDDILDELDGEIVSGDREVCIQGRGGPTATILVSRALLRRVRKGVCGMTEPELSAAINRAKNRVSKQGLTSVSSDQFAREIERAIVAGREEMSRQLSAEDRP